MQFECLSRYIQIIIKPFIFDYFDVLLNLKLLYETTKACTLDRTEVINVMFYFIQMLAVYY